ncbi:MAG: hypothetical protein AAB877_00245, partial [Patescibacteria group bacterium]
TIFAKSFAYAGLDAVFAPLYITVAIVLLLMTILLIERYIMLAILFILSPLAFVFFVFPFSKSTFSKWWHNFIKWCFSGVVVTFFLGLAMRMFGFFPQQSWNVPVGSLISESIPRVIMQLLVVMGFLVAGFRFAKGTSGFINTAAGMAVSGAKATAALVGGATVGTIWGATKTGAKMTGIPGIAQRPINAVTDKLRDWSTRTQERLGIVPAKGTLAKQQEERASQSMQKYDAAASKLSIEESKKVAEQWNKSATTGIPYIRSRWTGVGNLPVVGKGIKGDETKKQEAANVKRILESGNGHLIGDTKAQIEAAKYAESYYGPATSESNRTMWSKLKSKNSDVAVGDEVAVNEEKRKLVGKTAVGSKSLPTNKTGRDIEYTERDMTDPNATLHAHMEERAQNMAVKSAALKYDNPEIKKRNDADNIEIVKKEIAEKGKVGIEGSEIIDHMAEKGTLGKLAKALEGLDKLAEQIDHTTEKYGSTAKKSLVKIDPRFAARYKDDIDDALIFKGIKPADAKGTEISAVKKELIAKSYSRVNAREINDMDDEAINTTFIKNTTKKKISRADNLSIEKIGILGNLLPDIAKQINAMEEDAKEAGDPKVVTEINRKISDMSGKYEAIRLLTGSSKPSLPTPPPPPEKPFMEKYKK